MSDYQFPKEDEEKVFYLVPEIGKRNDHDNLHSILYVRKILDKLIKEYNIQPNQSIGMVGDIQSFAYMIVDLIDGYNLYRGHNFPDLENDIDFENPLPDNF